MGVPAFFQWLKERYPTIMHDVVEGDLLDSHIEATTTDKESEPIVQQCDNFYLDLNGIIHPCCHPEEGGSQPRDEEEMVERVVAHIDRLVDLMRPRHLLYLAIDGVAPRGKMNQQRTRRYCAAQEREETALEDSALRRKLEADGAPVPPPKPASWDHNVITPGTAFMEKLARGLRAYICARRGGGARGAPAHPRWAGLSVVLSDATVPGEGEHKIMDYVRALRRRPGYDPATSHCICGEDADLIMLGLALHEAGVESVSPYRVGAAV